MNLRLKRAKELAGYALTLTGRRGSSAMLRRAAGFCGAAPARPARPLSARQGGAGGPARGRTPRPVRPHQRLRAPLQHAQGAILEAVSGQLSRPRPAPAGSCAWPTPRTKPTAMWARSCVAARGDERIRYAKMENKGIAANTNAAAGPGRGRVPGPGRPRRPAGPPRHLCHGAGHLKDRRGLPLQRRGPLRKDHGAGPWWPTSSRILPRSTSWLLQLHLPSGGLPPALCFEKIGGERGRVRRQPRTTTSSGGSSTRGRRLTICPRCSTTGGCTPAPPAAAPGPSPMWPGRRPENGHGRPPGPHRPEGHPRAGPLPRHLPGATRQLEDSPLVSILIPNKDHIEDLEKCLRFHLSKDGAIGILRCWCMENNSEQAGDL